MLWTGGNGTGLSYCLKYADDSTDENPVVLAKGVDEMCIRDRYQW